jgi:hypothetical protein
LPKRLAGCSPGCAVQVDIGNHTVVQNATSCRREEAWSMWRCSGDPWRCMLWVQTRAATKHIVQHTKFRPCPLIKSLAAATLTRRPLDNARHVLLPYRRICCHPHP